MTQHYFNWAWIILFITITWLRKFHEHRAGKCSSLKDTPFIEALFMMLWGMAAGILPFFYIFSHWLDFANYSDSMLPVLGLAGIALFIVAIGLLHRSHTELGKAWSSSVKPTENVLLKSGIFKYIRHPMYSAHLLWGVAQTLLFPNFIAGPLALVLILITVSLRIPREEALLLREFGEEYDNYMKQTGRLLPKIRAGKKIMEHEKIDYIEMGSRDMAASKGFFRTVFAWDYTDYGPEYSAFHNAGIDGGFYPSKQNASTSNGSALIVFYSKDLEQTRDKIIAANGEIVQDIFSFPGGRRFHFREPGGNELAVWSDQ